MGGRGSSGFSKSLESSNPGAKVTIGRYQVENGIVTLPKGQTLSVTEYSELSAQQMQALKRQMASAGVTIDDPVLIGKTVMPRAVAERAILQNSEMAKAFKRFEK